MTDTNGRRARTALEYRIWQRRESIEEFAHYVERFAREHGEPGTLSVRHIQRLAAGRRSDDRPLGPVRPATARLLERIFGTSVDDLLAPPSEHRETAQALTVAIAVVTRGPQVLIVCRRDGAADAPWQFPTGIIKPGAAPEVVAVQETLAETGVESVAIRRLGSRLHPITNVFCHYLLCRHVAGDAKNMDPTENVAVAWVDRAELTTAIPANRIYLPVIRALDVDSSPLGRGR